MVKQIIKTMKLIYLVTMLIMVGFVSCGQTPTHDPLYDVVYPDDTWKKILSNDQYNILRKSGTERAFTSPLNWNKKEGLYLCAADSTQLFNSRDKFDSGTGWPSFDGANNLEYEWDGRAIEVRCITCGSHLGHLFKDEGFTKKNLRYCINGDALLFWDGSVYERGDAN